MKLRSYWLERIENSWKKRSLIWLYGVRRTGKTVLSQSLDNVEYFDCELPRVRRLLEDPEAFWEALRGQRVVLDEIQRLPNPSETLKIATDHFSETRVLATGSSTLQASARFRDTLTGRKSEIWLTPMMSRDLLDFGSGQLKERLQRGGLPPYFLSPQMDEHDYEEWLDSFWARDIQELFRLERRWSFQRFLQLLLAQSGGIFEASRFAGPCEISRTTVANYLDVMEATRVVTVVRPFHSQRATEIISAPKVYGFDTGFVCHHRGWTDLRPEDWGDLWEHYVLNEIAAGLQSNAIHYWRDKRGHEVDLVLAGRSGGPLAIECKWSMGGFSSKNLHAFRRQYPEGENWLVASDIDLPQRRALDDLSVDFINLQELARRLNPITS
ncbi:ATP-binding protein [bacterium]|nr:ATP-binding protein [bacterium]